MRRFWWLCVLVVLGGCAGTPAPLQTSSLVFRPVVTHFEVAGRLSAQSGEEALNGKFVWQHSPDRDQWDFFSPFGQVVARLNRQGDDASLITANGQRFDEPFAQLVSRVLGMSVPVSGLSRWVQAGVAANEDVRELDAVGRPQKIIDSGWQVRYPSYASERPDARPRIVEVSRGDANLKLVIDSWQ
jgi:outer membrane lipoprotein LolB